MPGTTGGDRLVGLAESVVLRANAVQPPHLPTTAFVSG